MTADCETILAVYLAAQAGGRLADAVEAAHGPGSADREGRPGQSSFRL